MDQSANIIKPIHAEKHRVLSYLLISLFILVPFLFVYSLFIDAEGILVSTLILSVFGAISALYYFKKRNETSALYFVFATFLSVVISVLYSGGLLSPLKYSITIPLIVSLLFLPRKASVFFISMSIGFLVFLILIELHYPRYFQNEIHGDIAQLIFQLFSIIVPFFILVTFSYFIVNIFQNTQRLILRQRFDIQSSIRYTKHIADSTLPDLDHLKKTLDDIFTINVPKEIVSGTFYQYTLGDKFIYIALVDCNRVGISGSFLSVINNCLIKIISFYGDQPLPSEGLAALRYLVHEEFNSKEKDIAFFETLDMGLCRIDYRSNELVYASANLPLVILNENGSTLLRGEDFPITKSRKHIFKTFNDLHYKLIKEDQVYMLSNGLIEQYEKTGNELKGIENLMLFLENNREKSMKEQKRILEEEIKNSIVKHGQLSDIIGLGLKL